MLPDEELRLVRLLMVDHMWHFDDLPFPIPPHLQNIILGPPVAQLSYLSGAKIMASAWSGWLPNFSTNGKKLQVFNWKSMQMQDWLPVGMSIFIHIHEPTHYPPYLDNS